MSDEKELPPWLTTNFLVTVLQEGDESCEVGVLTFSAKLAVPPGSNFTSHIYRVQVEYTLNSGPAKKISLMIKAPITKGMMSEMLGNSDPFEAEPRVYGELLPKLKKKVHCDFGPKAFPCPMRGMILKDLKEDGFVVCDRLNQFDFEHCKIALTLLANFHAASVGCYHDDPEYIRVIGKERFYNGMVDGLNVWFSASLKEVGNIIQKIEGCKESADYILDRTDVILESIMSLCKPVEGKLNVLNHGDFWLTNMLFKYDDQGQVSDIKFIDFQVIRYTSPVLDLLFFIYSSANPEARSRQRELFQVYLQTFNSSLESIGCEERLTPEQFDEEVKRCIDWAVLGLCMILPIVLCDPDKVIDVETFSKDEFEEKLDIFHSKKLVETIPNAARCFQDLFFSGKPVLGS